MNRLPHWLLFAALILTTFIITGCGILNRGSNNGAQIEFITDSTVYTDCSNLCRAKGQCGTATDPNGQEINVVLINTNQPSTRNHGAFVASGSAVRVQERRVLPVSNVATGTLVDEQYPFYRVLNENPQVSGWVDGACLADRQP